MRVEVLRGNCQETVPCEMCQGELSRRAVRGRHVGRGVGGGELCIGRGGREVIRGDGSVGGWRGCMAVCAIPHK